MIATPFSRRLLAAGLCLGLSPLASCGPDTEAEPTFGRTELYPLRVGTYRIFAVADTVWRENRPTISRYEQREVVADSFPGPANQLGQPSLSYRVVRARRADAAQAWVEDSVFVLTPLPQALLLSSGNVRTLELLFPVRAGRVWNRLAFDAQDSLSREYRRLGEAVTLTLPAGQTKTYERTVRTTDFDQKDDVFYQRSYEQIYAPGMGPVQRRRRNLSTFTLEPDGRQIPNPDYFIEGSTHHEVLLETGRL